MIDPRIASLLSPKAKFNAGLRALGELSSQLVNRGAPRYSPTPPPMNLGRVMDAYNSTIENDLQRGLAMHQFKRSEDEYARKEAERDAIANALKPQTVETMDNDMAPMTVQQPSALMQTVPERFRPTVQAFANAGQGQQALGAILGAALKPRPRGSSLMQEAQLLFPNDLAKQRAFIEQSRNKAPVSLTMAPGGENYRKATIEKHFGEIYTNAVDNAAAAASTNRMLDDFTQLQTLDSTGKIMDATLPVRQFFHALGVEDGNVPVNEAMKSIENKFALSQHKKGMGPMTDPDFIRYRDIGPKVAGTYTGNALIIQRLRHEARGNIAFGDIIRKKYLAGERFNPADVWRQVRDEIGPMMPVYTDMNDLAQNAPKKAQWVVVGGETQFVGVKK